MSSRGVTTCFNELTTYYSQL